MENQHRLIKGYRELTQDEIDRMNSVKELEAMVLAAVEDMRLDSVVDGRWLAIGRTHIEQGFMAVGRAIARPTGYAPEEG